MTFVYWPGVKSVFSAIMMKKPEGVYSSWLSTNHIPGQPVLS